MMGQENRDRVLVVDDSRSILGMVCSRLEQLEGVLTECAGSLAEARELLAADPLRFSFAVLDLNLPDAPNGEVVDYVQGLGLPVIVLTGSLDQDIRRTMFEKRVVDYEVKQQGVGIEHVVELISRLRYYRDSRILVVDDSASFRTHLESLLKQHGYRTLAAGNGPEALRILAEEPDIVMVITDYSMPEMDGATLVIELRKLRASEELAIIGVSSGDSGSISVPLLKNGASDFIPKSFEVEEFYSRVDRNLDMLRYVREAREAANRDFLTRLYNRRYFFSVAETMYANARRGNIRIALAMVDIDHFKRINDTYGHDIGDQVLVQVADAVRKVVRNSDLVARFGGEEFVCLTVIRDQAEAELGFERIRQVIENLLVDVDGETIRITTSVGVCTQLADSLEGMLTIADQNLYSAKQAGRNRVVLS